MSRTISRAACEAEMDGKAAPFTVMSRLDFYHELYQSNLSCMLSGLPYSQIVMDAALNAIMSIAIEDEMHQRLGEEPEPLAETIGKEAEKFVEWMSIDEAQSVTYGTADLTHSHLPVKVMTHTYSFRHGGTHPLSDVLTAYTWCSKCGEILSLDNELARQVMPDF